MTKKIADKQIKTRNQSAPKVVRSRKGNTNPLLDAAAKFSKEREELIVDIQRVQQEHPEAAVTRNYYRAHGKFSEGRWQAHFSRFSDFRIAAGMVADPGHVKESQRREEVAVTDKQLVFNDKYVHNENTDTYIIFLDRAGQRLSLSGEQVRAMKTAYSNWDGNPQTINEICRTFGIRRDWFMEMKAILGWTHDSEPFTDEELTVRPQEDMVKDVLQMQKLKLFRATEKAKWQSTVDDADKWRDFETNVLIPLQNHIAEHSPNHKITPLVMNRSREKYALVIAPFDLHYGKYGWTDEVGESYTRAQAREALMHHTKMIAKQVEGFGRPEKIICASASDYFHVDNQQGHTTSGTPQDMDGTRSQILIEGCELAAEHAELLAQIAPVEWIGVPGNHDRDSALSAMLYMNAYFRNNKRVSVEVSAKMRRATMYGNSLLTFFHGHGLKVPDMMAVMSKDFRDLWRQADKHYAFSGHLHHEVVREIHGMKHYQVPSLAGKDRWTSNNGYVTSDRAMTGYMVSQNRGIIAELISPVVETKALTGIRLKRSVR